MASEAENALARQRADDLARSVADEQAQQQAYALQVANMGERSRQFDASLQSGQEAQAAQLGLNRDRFQAGQAQQELQNQRYDQQNQTGMVLSPGGVGTTRNGVLTGWTANNRNIPGYGGRPGSVGTMTPGGTGMQSASNPWETGSFGGGGGGGQGPSGPWDTGEFRQYYGGSPNQPAPSTWEPGGGSLTNRPFMGGYLPSQDFRSNLAQNAYNPGSIREGMIESSSNRPGMTTWSQNQYGSGSSVRSQQPNFYSPQASNTIRLGGNRSTARPGMTLSNRFYAS